MLFFHSQNVDEQLLGMFRFTPYNVEKFKCRINRLLWNEDADWWKLPSAPEFSSLWHTLLCLSMTSPQWKMRQSSVIQSTQREHRTLKRISTMENRKERLRDRRGTECVHEFSNKNGISHHRSLYLSLCLSGLVLCTHSLSLSIYIGNVFVHVKYAQRSVHVFVRLIWVKYIAHWDIFVGGTNVQNLSLQKDGTNFGCVIRLFHRKVEATGE